MMKKISMIKKQLLEKRLEEEAPIKHFERDIL